jgi:hypothetical protein
MLVARMAARVAARGRWAQGAQRSMATAPFNWEDPLDLDSRLTEEERLIRVRAQGGPRGAEGRRGERFGLQ